MKKEKPAPELTLGLRQEERELTLEGECVLRWHITWPEFSGTWKGLGRINRYYARYAESWRERWGKELYVRACLDLANRREAGERFRPWRAELSTQVTRQEEGLVSLWQEAEERWGFDRPLTLRTGDTWSLEEGCPRTLASFFPKRLRWRREVLRQAEEQVKERLAGGESLLDPECAPRLRREFQPERFYLTEEGAEVFYPMYVLGPSGEGTPSFSIRLPELV